jgi:hypothetical protein
VQAIIFLADAAQVSSDGKLSALGAGWSITSSPSTAPSAIAIIIFVPWDEANRKHTFSVELLDADGHPIQVTAPNGTSVPLRVDRDFEVGRPPGIKAGMQLTATFSISLGPLNLQPDSTFEWKLTIDGATRPEWSAAFATRPFVKQQPAG